MWLSSVTSAPVCAEPHDAAVVLVASSVVQHACVDDVTHRDVQIIGTQSLQQPQGLISGRLTQTHTPVTHHRPFSLSHNTISTHGELKLGEGGHVEDAHRLLTALDLRAYDIKPVRLVEGLALIQRQQICADEDTVTHLLGSILI